MADALTPFDRQAVRRHRDRAATAFGAHDFLFAEVAEGLAGRVADVRRDFQRILDLGSHGGMMARALAGTPDAELFVSCDMSPEFARRAPAPSVAGDEEALPFAAGAFDLVVSALSLHWVNDLPGALIQIRRALKPDGLFLGALLGGETLAGLRRAWLEAEAAVEGGASPRVSPFADIRDAGALLQRAGFALPVADTDSITVTWPDALALMAELRAMGEGNALAARRRNFVRRETLMAAAARCQDICATRDGRVSANFDVIYLTGWAPHDSQQQPLRPGSAAASLADALGTEELPAGEKAGR